MPGGTRNSDLKVFAGANARRFRERLGLTQEATADAVRVSPRYYRDIELGLVNLTLETLARVADALGVPAHQLLRPARPLKRKPGRPKKRT